MPDFDALSNFVKEHGILTLIALGLFGVLLGWIPSVLTTAIETQTQIVRDNGRHIQDHARKQDVASSKLINLSLTDCVLKNLRQNDSDAAKACTDSVDDSEYIQKKRLENLITQYDRHQ